MARRRRAPAGPSSGFDVEVEGGKGFKIAVWDEPGSQAMALRIVHVIKARVAKGLDAFDKPFKPYSADYAQRKGQQNVDMRVSGAMLDGFVVRAASDKSARIDASGRPRRAYAWVNQAQRKWAGISPEDEKKLQPTLEGEMDRLMSAADKSSGSKSTSAFGETV